MLKDIVAAEPLAGYRLRLKFEDGVEGEVEVSRLVPFDGVFAALRDSPEFAKAAVDAELGCVQWPNGADLDPDMLYALVTTGSAPDLTPGRAA